MLDVDACFSSRGPRRRAWNQASQTTGADAKAGNKRAAPQIYRTLRSEERLQGRTPLLLLPPSETAAFAWGGPVTRLPPGVALPPRPHCALSLLFYIFYDRLVFSFLPEGSRSPSRQTAPLLVALSGSPMVCGLCHCPSLDVFVSRLATFRTLPVFSRRERCCRAVCLRPPREARCSFWELVSSPETCSYDA